MERKRILITGGSGFLGSILAEYFREEHAVAATFSNRKIALYGVKMLHMNFTRPASVEACLDLFEPDVIIHCAAIANPAICQKDPDLAFEVNEKGTGLLIDHMPNPSVRLFYISTDLVFDGERAPYDETAAAEPLSVYGQSKLAAERVALEWKHAVVIRPALIFGPMAESEKGSFAHWMDNALRDNEPVKLFEDEYRTPVYALDVARAIERMLDDRGPHRVYHAGGPERVTRVEFAETLCRVRGYDPSRITRARLADLDTGYPRARDVSLDSSRLVNTFQHEQTSIEAALREMFA
ncbi:MAG: sugar nucleotide-binding protein [bacterium]|nr:sugar nucleotide-binding protein [bacterium]